MDDVILAALVVLTGLLVGNEFGSKLVVHPSLARLDFRTNILAEREIYRGEARWVPFLMIGATVAAFVSAGSVDGTAATLCLTAALALAATIAITLLGNMPLNLKVFKATPDMPEAEWRSVRRRWDRLHTVRIVLDACALLLVAAAVTQ